MTIETFFTSDSHFFHKNIINFCNRPYQTVEEMNEDLISRWNARVKPNDTVYHLGDVSFGNTQETGILLSRLNGHIHLIFGNHDEDRLNSLAPYFTDIQRYQEIKFGPTKAILFHFPMAAWHHSYQGYVHLHGHTHNRLKEVRPNRFDVGVDSWNMDLVHIDEILARRSLPQNV